MQTTNLEAFGCEPFTNAWLPQNVTATLRANQISLMPFLFENESGALPFASRQ